MVVHGIAWSQWELRTRCRLMNAVEVGDPSLIPCSQWVIINLFACFHSCVYKCGMSSMHVCAVYSVRTQDSVVMGVQSTLRPVYAVYEWFMSFASTSHFDWVAFPHTDCKGVAASTLGTKDPLLSDECSSSGWSELYPLLSVSKINAVCMLSLLWVQSGMSSIYVCVV